MRMLISLSVWVAVCLFTQQDARSQQAPVDRNTDAPARRSAKPNVILLLADDLGSGDIGCYGGPVKTPVLDGLAKRGVKFTNFYSAAPVCSPARATLLTGRHHVRTGVYTVIQDHLHDMHLQEEEVTIAEILKQNGYDTAHVGKWHLGTPFRGRDKPWIDEQGFDYWFATDLNAAPSHRNPVNFWRNRERVGEMEGYACQLVADEAIDWLSGTRNDEKPFFLNVWFHEPHAPLAAPDEIIREYGELNDQAAIYSATIDNTDRAIGRLVEHLKEIGEFDNTVIIYTSDHGSYRHERNGNLRAGKGSMFEGGLRVPGIICWPNGIQGGRIETTPGAAMDILPTIVGLVGAGIPADLALDGSDLTAVLQGDSDSFKRVRPLTWHSPVSQPVAVIREGDFTMVGWRDEEYPKEKAVIDAVMEKMRVYLEDHLGRKLNATELWHECYNNPFRNAEYAKLRGEFVTLNSFQERWTPLIKSGTGGITRLELYDLSKDPKQSNNVINDHPELANRLELELRKVHEHVLRDGPIWGTVAETNDKEIHGLDSQRRSRFDAFAYINRIPVETEDGESQTELSARIASRLANQEGRVLIKLPPEMNHYTYYGFRLAAASTESSAMGKCVACHTMPSFSDLSQKPAVTSMRNRSYSLGRLQSLLANEAHKDIKLDKQETIKILAFLYSLKDLSQEDFREAVLEATVLDTSGDLK